MSALIRPDPLPDCAEVCALPWAGVEWSYEQKTHVKDLLAWAGAVVEVYQLIAPNDSKAKLIREINTALGHP